MYDPQTLYRHPEHEQWNAWAIDLAADQEWWQNVLSDQNRGLVVWT